MYKFQRFSTCPNDNFSLPNIDTLVDNIASYEMLAFMDDFSRYNQIWVSPNDQHKTTFTTSWEILCYKIMLFGLKNINTTY